MTPIELAQQCSAWQGAMLRFARLHLSPREEAEDAVQDTLAAILESETGNRDVSDPKGYVFGILKHKITDRLRRKYQDPSSNERCDVDDLDDLLFDANGHWTKDSALTCWQTPELRIQSDQFFAIVDACVHRLPVKVAQVFSMKELLECDAQEVCSILGLNKTDYWQCMSRARKQLQICLSQRWFNKAG